MLIFASVVSGAEVVCWLASVVSEFLVKSVTELSFPLHPANTVVAIRIIDKINKAQFKKFEKYEKDISEFIKSFDYNNAGKKEEAPKDTVLKSSYFLNGEFEKATKKLEDV